MGKRIKIDFFLLATIISASFTLSIFISYRLAENLHFSIPQIITFIYVVYTFFYIFLHSFYRIGRLSFFFFVEAFIITTLAEFLGASKGFLFGKYRYSNLLGPKILGEVPVVIPIFWFLMFYCSYSVARLLIFGPEIEHQEKNKKQGLSLKKYLILSILAAVAMVAWDFSADPLAVSFGAWQWETEGGYYGIPFSNFIGWFIVSFVVFLILCLFEIKIGIRSRIEDRKILKHIPAFSYFLVCLNHSFAAYQRGYSFSSLLTIFLIVPLFVLSIKAVLIRKNYIDFLLRSLIAFTTLV